MKILAGFGVVVSLGLIYIGAVFTSLFEGFFLALLVGILLLFLCSLFLIKSRIGEIIFWKILLGFGVAVSFAMVLLDAASNWFNLPEINEYLGLIEFVDLSTHLVWVCVAILIFFTSSHFWSRKLGIPVRRWIKIAFWIIIIFFVAELVLG